MDLRELIDTGATTIGSQRALALALGMTEKNLSDAKAGRRGLPDFACFRIAEIVKVDPAKVIAASALVTEKDEERRKVFYPFVMGRAAAIIAATAMLGITALPQNAEANQGHNMPTASRIYIM